MVGSQNISTNPAHNEVLLSAKAMAKAGGIRVAFRIAVVEIVIKAKAAASRILLSVRALAQLNLSSGTIKAITTALVLTMAACAPAIGARPDGVSVTQWDAVTNECSREGAAILPRPVAMVVAGTSFRSESCGKHGCIDYSTYTPPTVQMQDAAAPLREMVVRSCFNRNTPPGMKP